MAADTVALAFTGASGMPYGLRLLECLIRSDRTVYLMVSNPARMVLAQEANLHLPSRTGETREILAARYRAAPGQLHVFGQEEWNAPVASGSAAPDALVICPCTSGTLAALAAGTSRNLIERAADVVLKERRTLILVPRELPFSVIHLENMLRLARAGAVILPPSPGFYHNPQGIQDLVDFVVARILDHLRIPQDLIPPWGRDERE